MVSFEMRCREGIIIPLAFLFYAVPLCLFLALATPPLQVADEPAHVLRAAQIGGGGIIAQVEGGRSGGPIDSGLIRVVHLFDHLAFHPERKLSAQTVAEAKAIGWAGRSEFADFTTSSTYAPPLYAAAAAAVAMAKAVGLPPLAALSLGRLVNAAVAIALAVAALVLCGRGRLLMFVLLTLPMPLSLFASFNPDGLLVACAALAVALVSRVLTDHRGWAAWELSTAAACLAVVALGKPPNALLAGLLLLPRGPLVPRLGAVALVGLATAGWLAVTAGARLPLAHDGVAPDAAAQLATLLRDPLSMAAIVHNTVVAGGADLWNSFVGVLGWLDTGLPTVYYAAAAVVMPVALLHDRTPWPARWIPAAAGLVLLTTVAATVLALYAIWSPVGAPRVEGLQGRYFLPAALLLPMVMPALPLPDAVRRIAPAVALAFPLGTLALLPMIVIRRYYLA